MYENDFDLHEKELVEGTHFHMNDFSQRLVLTQRQKATQKRPINSCSVGNLFTMHKAKREVRNCNYFAQWRGYR